MLSLPILRFRDELQAAEARGEARGKNEAMLAVAKTMLIDGDSTQKISKITGLSITEIEKLKF